MDARINEFLDDKKPAIVGISTKKEQWGNELLRNFLKAGYSPVPISKTAKSAEGLKCVERIEELSTDTTRLVFAVSKKASVELLERVEPGRFKQIWFVYGSKNADIVKMTEEKGIEAIYGYCPMMFLDGTGIHKFHYTIKKLFDR